MYYTIYKVINMVDGKIYIGSHKTKNLDDGYKGSGKYLKRAIEKYGIENFTKEILFVFDNPESMYLKESELVNEDFLMTQNTYNLKVGGFGGFDYINQNSMNNGRFLTSEKAKEIGIKGYKATYEKYGKDWIKQKSIKANESMKIKYPNGTFYGKKHSLETKKIIGQKNSISSKGKNNSQYGTIWITDGVDNKKILKDDVIPQGWKRGRTIKT